MRRILVDIEAYLSCDEVLLNFSNLSFDDDIPPVGKEEGMAYLEAHGGDCCGITHIVEAGSTLMGTNGEKAIRDKIEGQLRQLENFTGDKPQHMFEITLTDGQMMYGFGPKLKALGFRHVNRFKNSNSGNYVNVFHLVTGQPRGKNRKAQPFTY